jgi:hypothetical protein
LDVLKSIKLIIGLLFVVLGLILSFFFPIFSISPNFVIDYPPSEAVGDGVTFSEGKYLYQEFKSDVNLTFNSSSDMFFIGMRRDPAIDIPMGYGIIGIIRNMDPNIQSGDFGYTCFNIDIIGINPDPDNQFEVYIKPRWIDDENHPDGPQCKYISGYRGILSNMRFEIGKTYRIYMYAVNAQLDAQEVANAVALPGVYWQFTTVGNPEDSGESTGAVQTFFDTDFSFAVSSGLTQDDDPGNGGGSTIPDDDTTEDTTTSDQAVIVLLYGGPILFAIGVAVLASHYEYFTKSTLGYILLGVVWLIAFAFMFYLANYGVVL